MGAFVLLKIPESCKVVLASNSPRRKELLSLMGIEYIVDVSNADENVGGAPDARVCEISQRKALAVANSYTDAIIIAADTLVYDEAVLGKPKDKDDAQAMLTHLSGHWHEVYTGVSIYTPKNGRMDTRAEKTRVHFCEMTQAQIRDYIATSEPMDKAGAYAVQGIAGMYIDALDGSYSNVVGLPMHVVREMLEAAVAALDEK